MSADPPQVALTIDDFHWKALRDHRPKDWQEAMLSPLARRNLHAACYVIGANAEAPEGQALIERWGRAGHAIGNHTYSHRLYDRVSFEEFSADALQAESVLRNLPNFTRRFRFPALHEGETAAKRDRMRAFLVAHGYRNGYVTIDTSDWYVDQRLRERLTKDAAAPVAPYRDYYLRHMWDRAQFYDDVARKVAGRAVRHTLLLHYNVLNALFLEDLMAMFEIKGWRWIDAAEAYADPISNSQPKALPAGESLVWGLAKDAGFLGPKVRYPAEDGEYLRAEMDRLGL